MVVTYDIDKSPSSTRFRVMQYNILADCLSFADRYPHSGEFLKFRNRFPGIKEQISVYEPDILTMQEVDVIHLSAWKEFLSSLDMDLVFYSHPRRKHGVLVAFKKSKFKLLKRSAINMDMVAGRRFYSNNPGLVVLLQRESEDDIVVSTSHFYWHPAAIYDRMNQLRLLLEHMHMITQKASSYIIAADLNSHPTSAVVRYLESGGWIEEVDQELRRNVLLKSLPEPHSMPLRDTKHPDAKIRDLYSGLESVRHMVERLSSPFKVLDAYPAFTNLTPDFTDTIDHIYVSDDLVPFSVLQLPKTLPLKGLPNAEGGGFPSDHLPLVVEFD